MNDIAKREKRAEFSWNLLLELRKELVESQKLRAQIIGVKVAFVSAFFTVIAANIDKGIDIALLAVPAFAAIFFDFLINSYSYSIKRIGWFCRNFLEPVLRAGYDIPRGMPLWEEFLSQFRQRWILSVSGNVGITLLVVASGAAALLLPFRPLISVPVLVALLFFLGLDLWTTWLSKNAQFPNSVRDAARVIQEEEGFETA